jgi:hypothetical protein
MPPMGGLIYVVVPLEFCQYCEKERLCLCFDEKRKAFSLQFKR